MITDHYDGHGLNELISVEGSESKNGVDHYYELWMQEPSGHRFLASTVKFQKGARKDPSSVAGVTEMAVLAVVIDRLRGHQQSDYACRENAIALTKLEEAMHWMKARADNRAKRGVLGTNSK